MDEEEFIELTRRIMTDESPLFVTLQIKHLWLIDGALALAYRHPGLTDGLKAVLLDISLLLRGPIVANHPDAKPLLEMGWHEENDVPIDYEYVAEVNAMIQERMNRFHNSTGDE